MHFIVFSEVKATSLLTDAFLDGNIDTAGNMLDVSDINIQIDSGLTALHLACMHGYVDIVRMLLSHFARTDITDDERYTPAMHAEIMGHTEVLPHLQCPMSVTPDCLMSEFRRLLNH